MNQKKILDHATTEERNKTTKDYSYNLQIIFTLYTKILLNQHERENLLSSSLGYDAS